MEKRHNRRKAASQRLFTTMKTQHKLLRAQFNDVFHVKPQANDKTRGGAKV